MPDKATFFRWVIAHKELRDKYHAAVQARTDVYMEDCVDLSDTMPDGVHFLGLHDGKIYSRDEVLALTQVERANCGLVPIGLTNELIQKRKLQIESRIKASARMNPRKYGDKLQAELSGKNGGAIKNTVTIYMPANGRQTDS